MGLINWIINGAGFESDETYTSPEEKQKYYEEKMRQKEEKRNKKLEKKTKKTKKEQTVVPQKQAEPVKKNNADSYFENPDQYNTVKYDKPVNDYGLNSSNVGGYGTQNVEIVNPTRYEDAKIVINFLRQGESIMLNLNKMEEDAQRLLDCIGGAVLALNANLRRVDSNIFLITPKGFNIRVSEEK
ncbi:MAG: cell division protein SepF [Clostridia bacterium]|nr:cell division protein SepF [Clostridia bacterium]